MTLVQLAKRKVEHLAKRKTVTESIAVIAILSIVDVAHLEVMMAVVVVVMVVAVTVVVVVVVVEKNGIIHYYFSSPVTNIL
jgi:uncharacterized membrane protein